MQADLVDVAVRASGVTVLLLLAGMLFAGGRPSRLAPWFAPLAVCLAGFLFGDTPVASLRVGGQLGGLRRVAQAVRQQRDKTVRPVGAIRARG